MNPCVVLCFTFEGNRVDLVCKDKWNADFANLSDGFSYYSSINENTYGNQILETPVCMTQHSHKHDEPHIDPDWLAAGLLHCITLDSAAVCIFLNPSVYIAAYFKPTSEHMNGNRLRAHLDALEFNCNGNNMRGISHSPPGGWERNPERSKSRQMRSWTGERGEGVVCFVSWGCGWRFYRPNYPLHLLTASRACGSFSVTTFRSISCEKTVTSSQPPAGHLCVCVCKLLCLRPHVVYVQVYKCVWNISCLHFEFESNTVGFNNKCDVTTVTYESLTYETYWCCF